MTLLYSIGSEMITVERFAMFSLKIGPYFNALCLYACWLGCTKIYKNLLIIHGPKVLDAKVRHKLVRYFKVVNLLSGSQCLNNADLLLVIIVYLKEEFLRNSHKILPVT